MRIALALVPAILAATALSAPALAQDFRGPATITIDGQGEATATPDMAFINSGVTTQGRTAAEALEANSAAMTELIETLKAAGIEARDIQTSGFSVNPNYAYTDARDANGYTLPPKIDGYTVYNNVNVRIRSLPTLGAVLDKAVTVGSNTISGITFAVADPSKLYDQARKAAFEDARAKARLYADAAGVDLDDLRAITEVRGYDQPQPYMMRMDSAVAASAPVPVQSGELSFTINVTVTWSIEDR